MISLATKFKLCFFFHFLFGASRGRFISLYFKEQLQLEDGDIGRLLSVSHVLRIFATPFWGFVADKYFGRKAVYIVSILGSALFFSLNQVVASYVVDRGMVLYYAYAIRFGQSFFSSITYSILDAETLAAASKAGLDSQERSKLWGQARMYGAVSWGIASVFLGWMIDHFETTITLVPFTLLVGCITSCLAYSFFLPFNEYRDEKENKNSSNDISVKKAFFSFVNSFCKSFEGIVFIVVVLLSASGMMLVEGLSFLFFSEDLHFSYLQLGFLVIITVAFELPLFHYSSYLVDKLGYDFLIVIGLISYAVRVFVYTFLPVDKRMLIILVEWLHGITVATITTARTLKFQDFTPKGYESTFQSILGTIVGAGSFLGEFIGGYLFDTIGKRSTYRVSCISFILIGIAHVISSKKIKERIFGEAQYEKVSVELS